MTQGIVLGPDRKATRIAAARPDFRPDDVAEILPAIDAILRSGRLILGPHTQQFEEAFRRYIGVEHAVAVSTCSAALQIVFRHLQVRGREVILPTNNFVGVVSALLYEGGVPVLADMDPQSFCMDTGDALSRITPRTAGIVAVHIAGRIDPGMDRLRKACRERGLFLIEDASHAHGATVGGRKAGGLADAGCFSFYPTKIVTTGTGGMITTNDAKLADYARSLRHHGVRASLDDVVNLGNDWCLTEIGALLGLYQLKRLDENLEYRNRLVDRYRKRLGGESWVEIPAHPPDVRHSYYKLPMVLAENLDCTRFRRTLFTDFGIENGAIYDPPCHLQPVLKQLFGYSQGMFPRAEATLRRQLCPPMHSGVSTQDVDRVCDAMVRVAKQCSLA